MAKRIADNMTSRTYRWAKKAATKPRRPHLNPIPAGTIIQYHDCKMEVQEDGSYRRVKGSAGRVDDPPNIIPCLDMRCTRTGKLCYCQDCLRIRRTWREV